MNKHENIYLHFNPTRNALIWLQIKPTDGITMSVVTKTHVIVIMKLCHFRIGKRKSGIKIMNKWLYDHNCHKKRQSQMVHGVHLTYIICY